MDRRSFLASLAAACTALTSAATAAKGGVTVSAATAGFSKAITDAQRRSDEFRRTVLSMLKDCEVIRIRNADSGRDGRDCYSVVYRYAPGKPRGQLALQADGIAAIGTPVTMTVMTTFDQHPLHLGGYKPFDKLEPVQELVIQWHT